MIQRSTVIIATVAYQWVWGAHLGDPSIGGAWEPHLRGAYINFLELMAIKNVIGSFQQAVRGHHVLILTDNMTAMAYVNRQGVRV